MIADYRLVGVFDRLHSVTKEDGQIESMQNITLNFIGKGQAPNVTGHTVLHMVTHPDGTMTGSVDSITLDCPE